MYSSLSNVVHYYLLSFCIIYVVLVLVLSVCCCLSMVGYVVVFFFFLFFSFFFFYCFVFFQAEDGIRDLVRSRGLGDVYKRQERRGLHPQIHLRERALVLAEVPGRRELWHHEGRWAIGLPARPVSYTHLTLPTSDLV